jgi:hypothetical protein
MGNFSGYLGVFNVWGECRYFIEPGLIYMPEGIMLQQVFEVKYLQFFS